MNNNKLNIAAVGCLVVSASAFIYFGFGIDYTEVRQCKAVVSKYVTAEYSESSMNMDGETEYDWWFEEASYTYTAMTVDGELYHTNFDGNTSVSNSVYFPPMPSYDKSLSRDADFDRFEFHTDKSVTMFMKRSDGISDKVSISVGEYERCLSRLDSNITVKTWWGISYGITK